jgi:hypothetical protein
LLGLAGWASLKPMQFPDFTPRSLFQ